MALTVAQITGRCSLRDIVINLYARINRDPETARHLVFLTNDFDSAASTIADVYRQRWQIELFCKWIKQNLKVKSFLGCSLNAVLTQLWVAMLPYLLLAHLKFHLRLGWSLSKMPCLLHLNCWKEGGWTSSYRSRAGLRIHRRLKLPWPSH